MKILQPFTALSNKLFARLYIAQTISLLGDAFTWLGIALLAFEFGGTNSAQILATALTLRVTAYIIFGSYAGVLADRLDRKKILIITHLSRMVIVGLFPFVTTVLQVYVLIFFLNVFNAFFSPAYRAAIPQLILKKENYGDAITLSNATWQLLGILGPGLAGIFATILGVRQIFFFDAVSFILAAILIFTIPGSLLIRGEILSENRKVKDIWNDIQKGTRMLYKKIPIRFSLFIELVTAVAGAHILVNTVGHIKGDLHLTDKYYGLIMTAFGIGATIAAFTANTIDKSKNKTTLLISGAAMIGVAVILGNFASYHILMIFWVIAGLGQSFTLMPSQILIAENILLKEQGKVYGAHFAWSHLWWAIGYLTAGFTGTYFKGNEFLIGGILSSTLLIVLCSYYYFRTNK
ncbi:MAG: MFS transporter [Bacteroidota bacterium]|nr:MFS transporter [Bacteroidota bacterium]